MTHLLIDVSNCICKPKHLISRSRITDLFNEICLSQGLLKVGKAHFVHFSEDVARGLEEGLTGFQILSTSHISYHSNIEDYGFHADLYSCLDFDVEAVMNIFNQFFPSREYNTRVIYRDDSDRKESIRDDETIVSTDDEQFKTVPPATPIDEVAKSFKDH